MKRPPAYHCRDCRTDIDRIGEYAWMVLDVVWERATRQAQRERGPGQASVRDLLCVGCLERRLRRKLVSHDFRWRTPLTYMRTWRSERLLDRMGGKLAAVQALKAS